MHGIQIDPAAVLYINNLPSDLTYGEHPQEIICVFAPKDGYYACTANPLAKYHLGLDTVVPYPKLELSLSIFRDFASTVTLRSIMRVLDVTVMVVGVRCADAKDFGLLLGMIASAFDHPGYPRVQLSSIVVDKKDDVAACFDLANQLPHYDGGTELLLAIVADRARFLSQPLFFVR